MNNRKELPFKTLLSEPVRNGIYKKKEFHGRGAKIVNMGELFGYPRLFDIHMKRVELSEREIPKFLLREGDLLFARRSLTAEGAGKCSIVKEIKEPTTFESSIIRARPNTEKVDSDFLYYYFDSAIGKSLLDSILRQVAVAGITGSDLSELILRIPPLSEQQKIAFILSSLDDKIALNRKLNETLEEMARALFQSWFVDFDPSKAKLAAKRYGRDPERACMAAISGKLRIPAGKPRAERLDDQLPTADELDAAIAALDTLTEAQRQQLAETAIRFPDEFRESELGLIPVGWSIGDLNEFSELNSNSWTERNHPSEVAYVDLANCKNGCILSVQHYDWDSAPSRARRRLIEGDTIFGTVRPGNRSFALIGETETRLTGSTGFAVLSPRKPQFREFVYLHATSEGNINRLTHLADGAAYPAVRPDIVARYQIVSPSEAALVSFSKLVSDSFLLMQKHEHQSRTLAELRDTLLPKLLSGELSVNAAEDAVEKAAEPC